MRPTPTTGGAPSFLRTEKHVDASALARARTLLRSLREKQLGLADLREQVELEEKSVHDLRHDRLPVAFAEAGIQSLTLAADGNQPAYEASLKPYYKAGIAADWERPRQQKAFEFLEANGGGDLIKQVVTVELDKGDTKTRDRLLAALKKLKVDDDRITVRRAVPWQTLTAWVKEQVEVVKKVLPLDLIGAQVGEVVDARPVKEKKTKAARRAQ